MKGLCVLGSTGSIGTQTLSLVRDYPGKFKVISLAAGKNVTLLHSQISEFRPKSVFVQDESALASLKLSFPEVEFFSREDINHTIDTDGVDIVVLGMVGFAGLRPALHAVRRKKHIALANKEALVVAGNLFNAELQKSGARCIPVDSEHNALFQLLENQPREKVATIVLTASGGPLFRKPELPLEEVTPEIATKHPNWKMGPKISVDSATLMNKGIEVAEAHYLFGVAPEKIEVWIHPQSLVHGAVWLVDNTCLAQLTRPDMRSSIGHALAYPERLSQPIGKISFKEMANLEFYEPDLKRFPALRLAKEALVAGPSSLIVLNAANEVAVNAFLEKRLLFSQIAPFVEDALARHKSRPITSLDDVFALDERARRLGQESLS